MMYCLVYIARVMLKDDSQTVCLSAVTTNSCYHRFPQAHPVAHYQPIRQNPPAESPRSNLNHSPFTAVLSIRAYRLSTVLMTSPTDSPSSGEVQCQWIRRRHAQVQTYP